MAPNDHRLCFFRGRVALYTALQAMGIKPGDEVLLPGYTCIVVPNAVKYLGAVPVFVDIDLETYNIAPDLIEPRITPRTKVIIAQHTYGLPADMGQIADIARRHKLYLIEDCCHAVGSSYKGREVGAFGDVAFFSSQWSKPLTTGLGGWAIVNNQQLYLGMQKIHSQLPAPSAIDVLQLRLQYLLYQFLLRPSRFWFAQKVYRLLTRAGVIIGSAHPGESEGQLPPRYAMRMSSWQEEKLDEQLQRLSATIAHRKMITGIYRDGLRALGLSPTDSPEEVDPVYLCYPVCVSDKPRTLEAAREAKIELGDWFISPVHPNRTHWEVAGYQKGSCPRAEDACAHVINLPTHPRVSSAEAARTLEFIKRWI